ncbi:MAG: hypothetical protein MUF31_14865 [Akkermansiaceae bacterium]|jgi:hypothetical protein|nr:hypothetical protein [Akkermansiaceae bacterium]
MMKALPIACVALGASVGSLTTYLLVADPFPNSEAATSTPEDSQVDGPVDGPIDDPFWTPPDYDPDQNSNVEEQRPFDLTDRGQRDIVISHWYLDMGLLVDNLERNTGHKFEKQVGKVYAGPVEILEEQAAYMRRFLDETERMANKRRVDQVKPED